MNHCGRHGLAIRPHHVFPASRNPANRHLDEDFVEESNADVIPDAQEEFIIRGHPESDAECTVPLIDSSPHHDGGLGNPHLLQEAPLVEIPAKHAHHAVTRGHVRSPRMTHVPLVRVHRGND